MVINSQKVALLCPGQASQKVGMCNDLYNQRGFAKEHIDMACDILGYDIKNIMFNGPKEKLTETIHTQPAIFIASFIVGNLLINNGLKPKCIAGHSVGEVSAYAIAKSLDFEDGLRLVQYRAESMHKAGLDRPGSMAAVIGIDEKILEDICIRYSKGRACVANYNSPAQAVISGDSFAIEDIAPKILSAGALKVIKLNVSGAFHSPLMNSAKEKLNGILAVNELPLVSCDFNHNPASSIFDSTQTKVIGRNVKILAWYDNEWGFSNRMIDNACHIIELD